MISDINKFDAIAIANDARQGERALNAVYRFLGRFVAYPSDHAHVAHSLWVAHAHLMDRWESTPRIAFLSPEPASGKSRALEATEPLVPHPMEAVNMSASSLFRSIGDEEGLPTVLFDEVDTIFGPRTKDNNEDLRGLLNGGHHRGAKTYRSVLRGKKVEVEAIETFCAVALAGLGWLPDTLLSRSIIVRMRRRHPGEYVEPYRRRIHRLQGQTIRDQIETWARSLPDFDWPELPEEIQDRSADCWEPLLAVADAAGGDWPNRARTAAVALVADSREAEPSLGVRLLADLRLVFRDADEMSSKMILHTLHGLDESPWCDIKGKPLDERGLAYRLRQYGVKSKTVRIGDTTPEGYTRADLYDAWMRYAPPLAGRSATGATSATVALVADVAEKPEGARVCAQCNAHGGPFSIIKDGDETVYLHAECVRFWKDEQLDIPDFLRRQAGG